MKILIKKEGEPLYIYHHPRDVVYHKKKNTVTIGCTDKITFHLAKPPMMEWKGDDEDADLVLTFDVKDTS